MEQKVYTQGQIKEMLASNNEAVKRAVVAIWKRQTAAEKISMETNENNGIGFNGFDAKILSSFAEQINSRNYLSARQLEIARRRITKYAGQLTAIANEKVAVQPKKTVFEASECRWVSHDLLEVPDLCSFYISEENVERNSEGEIMCWSFNHNGNKVVIFND